ncbi:MAG: hypothetical protein K9G67_14410 [Bacteroidales bacterium]|nr:hypothetical protein [Bacteroidales bacterium]MCF8377547.1 hypothetical protein [Bacteroidales bacterium]MCF8401787.1 hypothetical protein [Bacteroidales bacterium]
MKKLTIMLIALGLMACSKTETLYENANKVQKVFSADQIRDLPKPVQKYFRYALAENQPYVSTLRLKHGGMFRLSPEKDWMEIRGKQYFTVHPPGFVWEGKTKLFKARDSYIKGEGNLSVYLFGLVRIVNKRGKTVNQAELLRWLGESVWMPTNLLPGENLQWSAIDDMSAKITFTYDDMDVFYKVTFNKTGQIIKLETERYMDENKLVKWIGKVEDYREANGMMIPAKIEASWMLEGGLEYTYARFHVTEFEFDKPEKF